MKNRYDTAAGETEAKRLDYPTIMYRIRDCTLMLPTCDRMDAEDGGVRGAWYREELRVLRAEKAKRDAITEQARAESAQ
jgi:hypothetical protein